MALEVLRASAAWPLISPLHRWAATMPGNPKVPVAMDSWGTDRLRGNRHRDETDCVDLPRLLDLVPDGTSYGFYLDSREAGIVVADIEPDCPEDLRERLLDAPWAYGEISVSGKGLHLLFLADDLGGSFVEDAERLRSENNWFEFLQRHWVTFTGKALARDPGYDLTSLRELYEGCPTALGGSSSTAARDAAELACARRPARNSYEGDEATLMAYLERLEYGRSPADFGDDRSTYEWTRMRWLLHRIRESREYGGLGRSQAEEIAAECARRTFPDAYEREVKKGIRQGLPWFSWLAQRAAQGIL